MKVTVISGSPKGTYSITLQSVEWLKAQFPTDDFSVHHIGQQRGVFNKPDSLNALMAELVASDLVLFAYPIYTCLAPSPLHRFIEVMKGHPLAAQLKGKWATQLTTSKHFYDHTAHNWLNENLTDLGMKVIDAFSADMDDLLTDEGRGALRTFWAYTAFRMAWTPEDRWTKGDGVAREVLLLTDYEKDQDGKLRELVDRFAKVYGKPVRRLDLSEIRVDGGCLGCFNCATDGKCLYKDGFDAYLRDHIQTADAVIYAAVVQDHSLGWRFKQYDDRQFCNGHRTLSIGKPTGYLLLGDMTQEYHLKTLLEARAQVGHQWLCGIVSETADEAALALMADHIDFGFSMQTLMPQNFLGIGGMNIFRDLIYTMGGLMRADYKFYKQKGFFKTLPHRQWQRKLGMIPIGWLLSQEKLRKKIRPQMNEGMISPYKRVVNRK